MVETGAGSVSPKRVSISARSGALTRATSHAEKPPSVSAGGEPRLQDADGQLRAPTLHESIQAFFYASA